MGANRLIDSEAQLRAAQSQTHDADLERIARARGFNSATEMMAWANQRNNHTGGTISGAEARKQMPSIRQGMEATSFMNPASLLDWIKQKIGGAMGD